MTSSRTCVERSIAFQPSETHPPQASNLPVGHAQTRHLRWSRRAPSVRIENWCSVEHAFVERDVGGRAVVFDPGWSGLFGTPEDATGAPFLTERGAPHLTSPHRTAGDPRRNRLTQHRRCRVRGRTNRPSAAARGGHPRSREPHFAERTARIRGDHPRHPSEDGGLRYLSHEILRANLPSRTGGASSVPGAARHTGSVSLLHTSCNPGAFERAALRTRGSPSFPPRIEGVMQGDQVEAVLCTFGAARNAGPAVTGVA